LDLAILTELLTRIQYRKGSEKKAGGEFKPLYPVLSLLSFMCKAPLVKPGTFISSVYMFDLSLTPSFLS